MSHGMRMEVTWQLLEVSFHLPQCGTLGLNSGFRLAITPLSTKLSCQHGSLFLEVSLQIHCSNLFFSLVEYNNSQSQMLFHRRFPQRCVHLFNSLHLIVTSHQKIEDKLKLHRDCTCNTHLNTAHYWLLENMQRYFCLNCPFYWLCNELLLVFWLFLKRY